MAGPITAMSSLSFSKRCWRNYILFTYLHMKQQKADSIVSSQRSRFLALPTNQKLPIISTVADRRRWLRLKTPSDSSVGQNDVARTHNDTNPYEVPNRCMRVSTTSCEPCGVRRRLERILHTRSCLLQCRSRDDRHRTQFICRCQYSENFNNLISMTLTVTWTGDLLILHQM